MSSMVHELDNQIAQQERMLAQLKRDREKAAAAAAAAAIALAENREIRDLAEKLHAATCRQNHIDMCDWEYGSWEQPGYAQKRYLTRAREVTTLLTELNLSVDNAFKLLQAMR